MSDNDDSFYDSFESGSDSDHVDGLGDDNFLHMNVSNLRSYSHTAFSSSTEGGASVEALKPRKDLLLVTGNGHFESLSDHDDWRYI